MIQRIKAFGNLLKARFSIVRLLMQIAMIISDDLVLRMCIVLFHISRPVDTVRPRVQLSRTLVGGRQQNLCTLIKIFPAIERRNGTGIDFLTFYRLSHKTIIATTHLNGDLHQQLASNSHELFSERFFSSSRVWLSAHQQHKGRR